MPSNKMLSALSYFSILFSPLLLPIIIYFVTNDTEVKSHAKRSLISHIIPAALLIVGFIFFSLSIFSLENRMFDMMQGNSSFWSINPLYFMFFYGLITAIVFIWNIVQGIRLIK